MRIVIIVVIVRRLGGFLLGVEGEWIVEGYENFWGGDRNDMIFGCVDR